MPVYIIEGKEYDLPMCPTPASAKQWIGVPEDADVAVRGEEGEKPATKPRAKPAKED